MSKLSRESDGGGGSNPEKEIKEGPVEEEALNPGFEQ